MKRLSFYQMHSELLIREMGDDLQDNSHKLIDKALPHLTTWLEDNPRLARKSEKNLVRIAKNIEDSGGKLYQEGHQIFMSEADLSYINLMLLKRNRK
jgi:hypothetical protein